MVNEFSASKQRKLEKNPIMNTDNSPQEMDPNLAKKLLAHGAVLIIAGVPKGTEFGIDLCSYTIGDNFRGVKMIPEGPHFVWCASQGLYGDTAPRVGFVHYFAPGEIVVREWDNCTEELRKRQIADAELEQQRIRQHICDLDRFLAPYDYRFVSVWKQLTDEVTPDLVEKCRPEKCTIRTNIELQSCPDTERPRGSTKIETLLVKCSKVLDENDLLPQLKPIEGTAPRFTQLPQRIPKDSQPADVSRHSMDCIAAVDSLVNSYSNAKKLVGEIQLSFIFFLVGHSVESLSHWRRMLHLFSHSETAVGKHKLFYMKYSELLGYQLPHLPEELMEPTKYNSVYQDVRSLLINLHASGLSVSAERLCNKLATALHWEFNGLLDEDPEDLPVIVENTTLN